MYNHCLDWKASHEERPRRCDFLVNGRNGVKWSHILLLVFGAVLWTKNLVDILAHTDVMAATVPTGEGPWCYCSIHNALVLLFNIMFTLRTSVLPPLSAVGAIVAILTDENGDSLTGGAVGGQTRAQRLLCVLTSDLPPLLLNKCTYILCRDGRIYTYSF